MNYGNMETPPIDLELMTIARIMELIANYHVGKEAKMRVLQYVLDRISMATSE